MKSAMTEGISISSIMLSYQLTRESANSASIYTRLEVANTGTEVMTRRMSKLIPVEQLTRIRKLSIVRNVSMLPVALRILMKYGICHFYLVFFSPRNRS